MRFSVKVSIRGAGGRFEAAQDAVKAGLRKGLQEWGYLAAGRIKRMLNHGARSGRVYARGKKGHHQASAPGEPPKTDFGRLVGTVASEVSEGGHAVRIMAGTKYAAMLEFGTSKMRPRPYFRRGVRETTEAGLAIVRRRVAEALAGKSG